MIIDITGVMLVPGNFGNNCPGNGENPLVECCCDECDYMMCCLDEHDPVECVTCDDYRCPHSCRNREAKA